MAADTGLSDGQIRIYRFIITGVAYLRDPGEGTVGLSHNSTERNTLEGSCRDISLIDRPQADQPVLYAYALLIEVPSGFQ